MRETLQPRTGLIPNFHIKNQMCIYKASTEFLQVAYMKYKNSTKCTEQLLSRGGSQHSSLNEEKQSTKLKKKKYFRFEDRKR